VFPSFLIQKPLREHSKCWTWQRFAGTLVDLEVQEHGCNSAVPAVVDDVDVGDGHHMWIQKEDCDSLWKKRMNKRNGVKMDSMLSGRGFVVAVVRMRHHRRHPRELFGV
jgi:hypothetical protein